MTIRKVRHTPVVKNMVLPDTLRVLNEETDKLLTEMKEQEIMKKSTKKTAAKKTTKKSPAKSASKTKTAPKGKKNCRTCGPKPVGDFCVNAACEDGLHSRCKSCERDYRSSLAAGSSKKKPAKKAAKKKVTKKTAKKKK